MKTKRGKFGLILLLFLTFSTAFAQTEKSRIGFKISEPDLIPEGIAYDSKTRKLYVGSTYLRKIISVDTKGAARNFTEEGQDGLRGVLGMRVDEKRRVLWAISSHAGRSLPIKGNDRDCIGCSEVFKYDLDTGKLIKNTFLTTSRTNIFSTIWSSPQMARFILRTPFTAQFILSPRRAKATSRNLSISEKPLTRTELIYPPTGDIYSLRQTAKSRRLMCELRKVSILPPVRRKNRRD